MAVAEPGNELHGAGLLKRACFIGTELLMTLRIIILSGYLPCYHKSVNPFTDGKFDFKKLKEYFPEHCPFLQYSARLGLWVSVVACVLDCLKKFGNPAAFDWLRDAIARFNMVLAASHVRTSTDGGEIKKFSFSHDLSLHLARIFKDLIDAKVSNDDMWVAAYERVSTDAKESYAPTYTPSQRAPAACHFH
jgi:hypothetical protein